MVDVSPCGVSTASWHAAVDGTLAWRSVGGRSSRSAAWRSGGAARTPVLRAIPRGGWTRAGLPGRSMRARSPPAGVPRSAAGGGRSAEFLRSAEASGTALSSWLPELPVVLAVSFRKLCAGLVATPGRVAGAAIVGPESLAGHAVERLGPWEPPRIGLRVDDLDSPAGSMGEVFRGSFSVERGMASLSVTMQVAPATHESPFGRMRERGRG
ncbi:hypothetical protein ACCAA_400050 [Candidatus Accumulibacter aalborgensis]|uniref:Uncharacterized protein n=1 Tax=Candidatus Accumulibacter aalborgensis TaxID=1860102 RepID=A0A1A8XPU0_9PROT|nr:hypothetical protein ACCAA_400050 [Candidatus Accumulibacter aalborgensis]